MLVCSLILPSLQTETFKILIFWTTPNVPFPATQSLRKVNLTELQTDSLSLLTPYQHQQSTTIIISNKIISTSSGFFFSICFAITLVILLFSIALHQNISWKQGSSQLQLSCWKQRLLNCRWSACVLLCAMCKHEARTWKALNSFALLILIYFFYLISYVFNELHLYKSNL